MRSALQTTHDDCGGPFCVVSAPRPRWGNGPCIVGPGYRVRVDRLDYFAKLAADAPDEPRARYGYANELYQAERWAEAADELRAYLALQEDEGNAWGRLGDSLARMGDPNAAADAYLTGIDQAEKFGHTGMADDFREAIEAL